MIPLTHAEQLLQSYGITRPSEIDLEAIAYSLGAQVKYKPLQGCEARIVGSGSSAIITVNSESGIPRQRFSIAHELGHWKYHRGKQLDCRADNSDYARKNASAYERTADDYAANLILPAYLLRPILRAHGDLTFSLIRDVADEFTASLTATAIRIVEINEFPCLVVCHGQQGRKWWKASSDVPSRWRYPQEQLSPESSALAILYGKATNDGRPERVPATAWFDRREAERYEVMEQTARVNGNEVLTVIILFDDEMLEES